MRKLLFFALLIFSFSIARSQLKFLIEDFEGFSDGASDLKSNGLYTYGSLKAGVDSKNATQQSYSGKKVIRIDKEGNGEFGGWGKGITMYVELDASTDHFNFYFFQPSANAVSTVKIDIHDDDNEDNLFNKDRDDSWSHTQVLQTKNAWELISIPLNKFKDTSPGGDGKFNISYREGKLLGFMISVNDPKSLKGKQSWYYDFICFSKGKLPTGANIFEPAGGAPEDFCSLGAWSDGEGKAANFVDIASTFESNYNSISKKKLGIVHFFQPFGKDDGASSLYPSAERINKVIAAGYIPMITLENHFIAGSAKQPNLYSITDGHFDSFLGYWAHLIKDVKGTVLLRILHEFNGDWYDWCTVKNDKNPEMVGRAFRYIHNIFRENKVTNVKFIWCPNSMSVPQEKWNYIMDAYPGDEYVDFVALDIYNGAGNNQDVWRSFRKEGIENYFILTQKLPHKPLLICETASRERRMAESGQNKGEWIREMSVALKTDMSKIRMLAWFNQTDPFRINSSANARDAYINYVLKDPFFRSGTKDFMTLIK